MSSFVELSFEQVSEENLATFKHLLTCLFPLAYPKSFFRDVVSGKMPAHIAVKAKQTSVVVGCLSWREKEGEELEILNFGVLVLQRGKGFGGQMLQFLLDSTKLSRICLHVHVSNEEAVSFYRGKGFKVVRKVERYYPRLEPTPDAFFMVLERQSAADSGVENELFSDQ